MEIIDDIPIVFDRAATLERLRWSPARTGSEDIDELIGLARKLVRPLAVFEIAFVGEKGEGTVDVGGVAFRSAVLRQELDRVNKVFPYIVTIGPDLERAASGHDDLLRQYYLEELANMALESAVAWLAGRLEGRTGLRSLSSLSPGSLVDWPITEQTKLFALFGDTERLVGVRLTDSLLMVPRKSVSGLLFPSEEGFVACQLCDRANCPGRKAPRGGQREEGHQEASKKGIAS
jgi:hypothetical protein